MYNVFFLYRFTDAIETELMYFEQKRREKNILFWVLNSDSSTGFWAKPQISSNHRTFPAYIPSFTLPVPSSMNPVDSEGSVFPWRPGVCFLCSSEQLVSCWITPWSAHYPFAQCSSQTKGWSLNMHVTIPWHLECLDMWVLYPGAAVIPTQHPQKFAVSKKRAGNDLSACRQCD